MAITGLPAMFTLPDADTDNFAADANSVAVMGVKDTNNKLVVPTGQYRRTIGNEWTEICHSKYSLLHNTVSSTVTSTAFNVEGYGTLKIQISGTFSATITFTGSIDGVNFDDLPIYDPYYNKYILAGYGVSAEGLYEINIVGLKEVKCTVAWSSGTSVSVYANASPYAPGWIPKKDMGFNTLYCDTVTVTTILQQLDSCACDKVFIQADPDNINDIYIGSSSSQPIKLKPGMSIEIPIKNLSSIYVKTLTSTATLNYIVL